MCSGWRLGARMSSSRGLAVDGDDVGRALAQRLDPRRKSIPRMAATFFRTCPAPAAHFWLSFSILQGVLAPAIIDSTKDRRKEVKQFGFEHLS